MFLTYFHIYECAKFSGLRAIVGIVGLVTSYHRAFMGSSWVINFFPSVFCGSSIFSHGYFVGPDLFRGYFVGLKFFLVGILWVPNFSSWVFHGSQIFSRRYFAGSKFSLVGNFVIFWYLPHEKKQHKNISETLFQIYSSIVCFSLGILRKYPVFIMFCPSFRQSVSSFL